jgi:hypothetical protein
VAVGQGPGGPTHHARAGGGGGRHHFHGVA